ncbi:unnamed protein product [Rotaria sordida]|uniref:sulfite oxidase n=1 Tax=Rotaria sordida TaxID=392033 RepID=A0A815L9G0_9BILA|nr:unnamed protein product [Rotaria sordida]CAF3955894.1 unnamed protein product [Rotaria sordida]
MVCAGNRRKEQNVVRKGNGFNWGSAGHSTALFTGVLVNEVLKIAKPKHGARYMCMEGADKLPNGYYGTSIRLSTAMDPAMGVMLAHEMNGEPLAPDHGRPLRVVIPGQIGGRSVKWLTITKEQDGYSLKFDHPTIPALTKGGWMEKVKEQGGELTDGFWGTRSLVAAPSEEKSSLVVKMTDDHVQRIITEEELSQHSKDGDAWFAVNGHVYNATEYLKDHPGGSESIILASGADASDDFIAIHSDTAKAMLVKYHIGILKINPSKKTIIDEADADPKQDIFIDQKRWNTVTLKAKVALNHDSVRLTFEFSSEQDKMV